MRHAVLCAVLLGCGSAPGEARTPSAPPSHLEVWFHDKPKKNELTGTAFVQRAKATPTFSVMLFYPGTKPEPSCEVVGALAKGGGVEKGGALWISSGKYDGKTGHYEIVSFGIFHSEDDGDAEVGFEAGTPDNTTGTTIDVQRFDAKSFEATIANKSPASVTRASGTIHGVVCPD